MLLLRSYWEGPSDRTSNHDLVDVADTGRVLDREESILVVYKLLFLILCVGNHTAIPTVLKSVKNVKYVIYTEI